MIFSDSQHFKVAFTFENRQIEVAVYPSRTTGLGKEFAIRPNDNTIKEVLNYREDIQWLVIQPQKSAQEISLDEQTYSDRQIGFIRALYHAVYSYLYSKE